MSQASQLLNGLSDAEIKAYSAGAGETEEHIVIGKDRVIRVPDALKKIAVEHDHNVETVTFDCPRYWDGLDMSKMRVYINYKLVNGYKDSYPADVTSATEDIMNFSWTISANVTQVKGNITFLICIKKTDAEGVEVNHWNSELCKDMYVSEGMECQEGVPMEYSDLYTQLLERMDVVEQINVDAQTMEELLQYTREASIYAEQCSQVAEDASNYIKNSYAPAIKGNASGEVIRVDDVSPIEHTVKAQVRGKNLIPYPYYDSTVSQDGVTFTIQEDGGIHISGTPTQNTSINLVMQYTKKLLLYAGKTYTLTCWSTLTSSTGYVYFQNWTNGVSDGSRSVRQGSVTIPITTDGSAQIGIVLLKDQTFDETVYVQFEEGLVGTEYVPYVDPTTVTVKRTGKNLACASYGYNVTQHGLTFTATKGSSEVIIDGTSTQAHSYAIMKDIILPPGRYTASLIGANIVDSASDRIYIHDPVKGTVIQNYIMSNKPQTFTITKNTSANIEIVFGANSTYSNKAVKIQIEYGESATAYEPYKGDVYTPNTAGGVSGITSFSPTMTLVTGTVDMDIDLEYNRDTTKVIAGSRVRFSNGDTITLVDNVTYYSEEEISDLTVLYPNDNFIGAIEFTTAAEGDISIKLPDDTKYIGEVNISNGETWELNVKNGVVVGGLVV